MVPKPIEELHNKLKMIFEEIYELYWKKVFRLCMGYVCDYDLAQDIAQETFLTVWQELPKFRNEANISTWIFRIASNKCLRQIEKQNSLNRKILLINSDEDTVDNLEKNINFLYKCISELSEVEKIIISLELEDLKQSEIATIVGLSESNVRVRIHRIKEKISKKFIENGYK